MGHLLEIVDGVLRSVRIIRPKSYCHQQQAAKAALCKTIHFVGCVLCAVSRYYLAGIVLCVQHSV